jgi:hypothetical protein
MKEPSKDNSGDKLFVKHKDLQLWEEARHVRAGGNPAIQIISQSGLSHDEVPHVAEPVVDHYDVSPLDLNEFVLDEHEHLVVKHDLFSHALKDGKRTPDGIAEAFIKFAKDNQLSFFRNVVKAPVAIGKDIAFSVKGFRKSFTETGRLDADYYQPKYEELRKKIELTGNSYRLGDVLLFARRGKQPVYADSGLPVINSKHVRDGIVLIDETNRFAMNDGDDDLTIREGDVLINGTGVGTIGRCAPYLEKFSALPDNHVTILRCRLDIVNPIYLATSVRLN